jgi:predicted nucleic acid-binding protein
MMPCAPDANVILYIFSEDKSRSQRARAILEDPLRSFVISDYLWLETLPKMLYNKQVRQVEYAEELFREARFVPASNTIPRPAGGLADKVALRYAVTIEVRSVCCVGV